MQNDGIVSNLPPDQVSRMQMLTESQARTPKGRQTVEPKPQETTDVTPESKTPTVKLLSTSTD